MPEAKCYLKETKCCKKLCSSSKILTKEEKERGTWHPSDVFQQTRSQSDLFQRETQVILQNHKSSKVVVGAGGIENKTFKLFAKITLVVTKLFNKNLDQEITPSQRNLSEIIQLYKKRNKSDRIITIKFVNIKCGKNFLLSLKKLNLQHFKF